MFLKHLSCTCVRHGVITIEKKFIFNDNSRHYFKIFLVISLMLIAVKITFSQILTFEFSGYAGNETTGTSNTNNSGINSTNSVITRGSGLTASNNANRFNAKSHQTGSSVSDAISGNDYFELVIEPNAGYQFSISSIDIIFQRSGTGPRAIALRNSLDSYASDLGSAQIIVDNSSSQSFTFTFSQSNSSSAVTYRFYTYNAEASTGTGGFEGSGNDIVVNGSVSSTGSSITWTGSSSTDWNTSGNWSGGSVPSAGDDVTIPDVSNDPILGSSTDVCADLTIQSGAVLTSNNGSYKLTASSIDLQSGGEIDIDNGEIECTGAFSHSGVPDMSGGTLDINGDYTSAATCNETISGGTITISGAWTGTNGNNFTPNGGTVTFDGSSDKIILTHSDANFHHLTISNTGGDVEADTDIDINGDLTISLGADLDIVSATNLEIAGNFSNSGTFTVGAQTITFDGTGTVTTSAISNASTKINFSKSSGSVTTNGNISVDEITVTSSSFIIDGETVEVDDDFEVSGGILQITSGLLSCTNNDNDAMKISGGTLDVDGGEVRLGELANDPSSDITMTSGTLDISGGTVNICDALDQSNGTITISGGILNLGSYTGSNTSTDEDRFEMEAGTLNLTAGTINIYGQREETDIEALDLASGVTVNANANNTINIAAGAGSDDEDIYVKLNDNQLGTVTISNSSHTVYFEDDIDVLGDITINSSTTMDIGTNNSDVDLGASFNNSGILAISGETMTFTGTGTNNIGTINDATATVTVNKSGGTLSTTGDLTLDQLNITGSGGKFLIDGETVTVDDGVSISAGTLQITSGLLQNTNDESDNVSITGGTLDIDGGTLTVGTNSTGDLTMTSGTMDLSNGILNIADELDVSNGTITQSGGTINIKSYVGSNNGSSSAKFEMDAGTLNLTAGTLRLNGQTTTSASSNPAMKIASGVSVTSTSSHTTLIQSNNTTSNDEDIYLDLNGNDLGALTVNLTGHEVIINSNVTINGNLTFTSGDISTNAYTLTLSSSSTVSGADDSKHLNGTCAKITSSTSAFTFPVGDGTRYRPIILTPAASNSNTYSVEYNHSPHSDVSISGTSSIDHISPQYHWDINRTSGSDNATISVAWSASSTYGTENWNHDISTMLWAYFDGSDWNSIGSTPSGSSVSGTLTTSSANTQWGNENFTLASTTANYPPLPVELISFEGICNNNLTQIEFIVASQVNNEFFTLERSTNLTDWEDVGYIDGGGTTSELITYNWSDETPVNGTKYYRISQTNINGEVKYFNPIAVECENEMNLDITLYPNPASENISIGLNLSYFPKEDTYIYIRTLRGEIIKSVPIFLNRGYNNLEINCHDLPKGIYFLMINGLEIIRSEKRFIKI